MSTKPEAEKTKDVNVFILPSSSDLKALKGAPGWFLSAIHSARVKTHYGTGWKVWTDGGWLRCCEGSYLLAWDIAETLPGSNKGEQA